MDQMPIFQALARHHAQLARRLAQTNESPTIGALARPIDVRVSND
jgi:hypothetical protein